MNFKRMRAMFFARNREFFRDKASFGWNFLFPFLLIAGFSVLFGGDVRKELKIGIFPCNAHQQSAMRQCAPESLNHLEYVEFVEFTDFEQGLDKLRHHKIDLFLDFASQPFRYWVSDTSPKGYMAEKIITAELMPDSKALMARQQIEDEKEIRYLDWLFPGILAMNMMFSALFGLGFIVVRYRMNGVLKRLKATPLSAFEYLSAQMLSRLFVLMFSLIILWVGCGLIFDISVEGSYLDLLLIFLVGSLSLISLGLVVASRGTSEEFTGGLLNFITWPMMFLSEVWFSIEGAPGWVKGIANLLPLTHLLRGVRRIMNDGAGLADISFELMVLSFMTVIFLTIGAKLFSWSR
ncbi:MAG: ABC transporter permease [Desulfobacteraceae bacterium]|nr:ABC transporter permease [Desulfobacteraceae bacterium]